MLLAHLEFPVTTSWGTQTTTMCVITSKILVPIWEAFCFTYPSFHTDIQLFLCFCYIQRVHNAQPSQTASRTDNRLSCPAITLFPANSGDCEQARLRQLGHPHRLPASALPTQPYGRALTFLIGRWRHLCKWSRKILNHFFYAGNQQVYLCLHISEVSLQPISSLIFHNLYFPIWKSSPCS